MSALRPLRKMPRAHALSLGSTLFTVAYLGCGADCLRAELAALAYW
eukprot:COSAG06_NODE_8272_length_2220_cov_0.856200_3_plen_46_part_00